MSKSARIYYKDRFAALLTYPDAGYEFTYTAQANFFAGGGGKGMRACTRGAGLYITLLLYHP
jgi:hypothetical protein